MYTYSKQCDTHFQCTRIASNVIHTFNVHV